MLGTCYVLSSFAHSPVLFPLLLLSRVTLRLSSDTPPIEFRLFGFLFTASWLRARMLPATCFSYAGEFSRKSVYRVLPFLNSRLFSFPFTVGRRRFEDCKEGGDCSSGIGSREVYCLAASLLCWVGRKDLKSVIAREGARMFCSSSSSSMPWWLR
jgi:hypothetical protein